MACAWRKLAKQLGFEKLQQRRSILKCYTIEDPESLLWFRSLCKSDGFHCKKSFTLFHASIREKHLIQIREVHRCMRRWRWWRKSSLSSFYRIRLSFVILELIRPWKISPTNRIILLQRLKGIWAMQKKFLKTKGGNGVPGYYGDPIL